MQGDADARLNIRAHTSLELESMELDLAALSALLNAVADTGSLQGGAERTGRSYRGAWGRIKEAETVLGCQLVEKTKGHGSQLTAAGRGLAALVDKIETRVQGLIQRELADITLAWPAGLPEGVIHADLFPDNVFFRQEAAAGTWTWNDVNMSCGSRVNRMLRHRGRNDRSRSTRCFAICLKNTTGVSYEPSTTSRTTAPPSGSCAASTSSRPGWSRPLTRR